MSPRDPELYHFFYAIGMAHFVAGRLVEAVTWAEKAENERPAGIGFGEDRRSGPSSLVLPGRMIVKLEDCSDGVEARVVEPGQPGD